MFLYCPAYQDEYGSVRCGLPAEVTGRFTMCSSDGAVESVIIRCSSGHWFNGPLEFLIPEDTHKHDPGNAAAVSTPRRNSRTASHDGLDSSGGSSRLNGAPAYYLGRPAWLWITAMSPRRKLTAPTHPVGALTGG